MEIKIKRIENGKLPEYKTEGSVGADCYARLEKPVTIKAGEIKTIPLGFAVEIPEGYEMQIRPRSGLASKSKVEAILGTIDSDYRGEVGAIVLNNSSEDFEVKNGDRIAQAVIAPVIKASWYLTDKLSETKRGEGGFGSTGITGEVKMSYPHKVEKFYEPFREMRKLEEILGKEVIVDKLYKAIFSRVVQTGFQIQLYFKIIGAVKENVYFESILNREIEIDVVTAFERVTIDGHRFGKEIEFE